MSSFPRRSARLSPQQTQDTSQTRSYSSNSLPTFATYSQLSSNSTTSHPSPSQDLLNPPPPPPTPHQFPPRLQVQSQNLMPQQSSHLHAPLPSPSAADIDPFFGRPSSQPNPYTSHQQGFVPQQAQQQSGYGQQNQQQHNQHHPHTNSISQSHPGNLPPVNPGQLPPDFLAEAAKRAQMACLMRDFGDVSL